MLADDWADVVDGVGRELQALFERISVEQWQVSAANVGWTCWVTAEHIAGDFAHYAAQVIGQPRDHYVKFSFDTNRAKTVEELREVVAVAGGMLSSAVRAALPDSMGWHPHGFFTPAGFAAIGAAEGLVHGHDIAAGLGIGWLPEASLAENVLGVTFPDAQRPPGSSAFDALLIATGRSIKDVGGTAPLWKYSAAAARRLS